jgi:hypothetical protein
MANCIWCGSDEAKSLEHIVPEALGCPDDFILREGVCAKCNHKNGRLDRALLTPYEIITVMKGIPRKKGKRPTVDGYATISSDYDENGPAFYINREKYAVETPSGRKLVGSRADDPIRDLEWQKNPDGTVKVSYKQEMRFDRQAVRGLFKIAVESIAFFEGLDAAHDSSLSAVKNFVLYGKGDFRAIMMVDQNPAYESYFSPCFLKDGIGRIHGMTLLGIGFACDFDADFRGGRILLEEMRKQSMQRQVVPNWPHQLWTKNNPPVD